MVHQVSWTIHILAVCGSVLKLIYHEAELGCSHFLMKYFVYLLSECRWTEKFGCTSPNDLPLRCVGGLCGRILTGNPDQCPVPCSNHSQCSDCLEDPNCGWCALESGEMTGIGVCVKGTLEGPRIGHCDLADYKTVLVKNSHVMEQTSLSLQRAKDPARWDVMVFWSVRARIRTLVTRLKVAF